MGSATEDVVKPAGTRKRARNLLNLSNLQAIASRERAVWTEEERAQALLDDLERTMRKNSRRKVERSVQYRQRRDKIEEAGKYVARSKETDHYRRYFKSELLA